MLMGRSTVIFSCPLMDLSPEKIPLIKGFLFIESAQSIFGVGSAKLFGFSMLIWLIKSMPLRVMFAMSTDFNDSLGSCTIELSVWQVVKARNKNIDAKILSHFIAYSFLYIQIRNKG